MCFVTGPPSGLTKTLPAALAELRKVTGPAKIMLGFDRTITYTTTTITVALDTPTTPKITQALRLLIEELNTTPPHIPGDPRPITYQLQPN